MITLVQCFYTRSLIILLAFLSLDIFGLPVSSEFLLLNPSARQTALGTAFVGLSDDPSALYCNPAGLAIHDRWQMSAGELTGELGQNLNSLFMSIPMEKSGIGISLSMQHFAFAKDIPIWKNGLPSTLSGTYSLAVSGGYARYFRDDLVAGISVKYIRESLLNDVMQSMAFDIGGLFQFQLNIPFLKRNNDEIMFSRFEKNVRLGLSLQNIGGGIVSGKRSSKDSLPLKLNAGLHFQPVPFIGFDYQFSSAFSSFFNPVPDTSISSFALELLRNYYVIPRIGYSFGHSGLKENKLSLGAGFKIDFYGLFYQLDYALKINTQGMNTTHVFSFTTGISPSKMKWISLGALGQRTDWIMASDKFEPWDKEELYSDRQELDIRNISVFLESFSSDPDSRKKQFDDKLRKFMVSELPEGTRVRFVNSVSNADLVLKSGVRISSNLIRISMACHVPGSSIAAVSNFISEYMNEAEEPSVGSAVFITRQGKTEIVPERSDVALESRQNSLLKGTAEKMDRWLERSGITLIPASVVVHTGVDSVSIYVDRHLEGVSGSDGKFFLKMMPGLHHIIARKMNYSGQDKDISVMKGSQQDITLELKKDLFYSDLIVHSSPEGVNVVIDGTIRGQTPLKVEKLLTGTYKLKIEKAGRKFEENVSVDQWGYNPVMNYVFDYDSEKTGTAFWNLVNHENGVSAKMEDDRFIIQGTSRDPSGEGCGFISREFALSDFEAGFVFRNISVNGCSIMAGLMDDQKNSVTINFDGRYFSVRRTVNGEEKLFVRALDKGKADKFSLRLRYNQTIKQFEAMVDDKMIENSGIRFTGHIRTLLMADATVRNASMNCEVDKIWIK